MLDPTRVSQRLFWLIVLLFRMSKGMLGHFQNVKTINMLCLEAQ